MGLSAGQWMTILADGRSQRHEQPSVRNVQCLHGQAKSDSNGTSLVISVCGPEFKSELVRPCTERHAVYFVPTIGLYAFYLRLKLEIDRLQVFSFPPYALPTKSQCSRLCGPCFFVLLVASRFPYTCYCAGDTCSQVRTSSAKTT